MPLLNSSARPKTGKIGYPLQHILFVSPQNTIQALKKGGRKNSGKKPNPTPISPPHMTADTKRMANSMLCCWQQGGELIVCI